MDKSSSERVLVFESDDALRSGIVGSLNDGGHEVFYRLSRRNEVCP